MENPRIPFKGVLLLLFFQFLTSLACAMQSANYQLDQMVINSAGDTRSAAGKNLFDSMGEGVVGQYRGQNYWVMAGYFNEFTLPAPTPTITCTPIRTFGGDVISQDFVYAAPNPIRGAQGNLFFDLAQSAEVTLRIYTTSSNLVISQHWDSLPAGTNHWVWNTANMANGVYLLWIKARGMDGKTTTLTKKLALVK
jgi:hypothetical protein